MLFKIALSFFLKYKTHDVADWLGEHDNTTKLDGFKWRGGRNPETMGIWMWSEIFTHDFENGEKVAIILLDTQGIYDSRSTEHDCRTIFALSLMLSSVQCFNLMDIIREDDLQHLERFVDYGRFAYEESGEKPFQSLVFIIRDWRFEEDYGWVPSATDKFLSQNEDQTPEMRLLRIRIQSSFDNIYAFLMPHPGMTVARGKNFTDLQEIDADFRTQLNELVPDLFAPNNLTVKKINGQNLRAHDVKHFLQTYIDTFNSDSFPKPTIIYRVRLFKKKTLLR